MRRRRLLIAGALALAGVLGSAGSAWACSCVERTPQQALRQADAAIVAKLLKVLPRDRYSADFRYRVRSVRKAGRGLARGRTVSVRASTSGAACGLPAQVNRRYGLLLAWNDGRWTSNSCNLLEPRRFSCAS
jgi:Tissue inhibitor of metalloproteinase